jgi:hypothetical protein
MERLAKVWREMMLEQWGPRPESGLLAWEFTSVAVHALIGGQPIHFPSVAGVEGPETTGY